VVEQLIKAGTPVDAIDAEGHTALDLATSWGKSRVVASLLANRANPNHWDYAGFCPLHRAAVTGASEIVDLLLEAGADPTAQADQPPLLPHDFAFAQGFFALGRLLESLAVSKRKLLAKPLYASMPALSGDFTAAMQQQQQQFANAVSGDEAATAMAPAQEMAVALAGELPQDTEAAMVPSIEADAEPSGSPIEPPHSIKIEKEDGSFVHDTLLLDTAFAEPPPSSSATAFVSAQWGAASPAATAATSASSTTTTPSRRKIRLEPLRSAVFSQLSQGLPVPV